MKILKVLVLLLLIFSFKENEAAVNIKNSKALSQNVRAPPDPLDMINDLANSQMVEQFVTILEFLNPAAGVVVGTVISFIKIFTANNAVSAETQMILDAIDAQTRILMDALSVIYDMINQIGNDLNIQFDKILFEQKYRGLNDNIFRINSAFNQFGLILVSYTEEDELIHQLKKFVQDTRDKNLDFEIVEPVVNSENIGGVESIITSYISFIIHNDMGLRCTPNQQIEWFYNHILEHADRINVLILTTYELLETVEKVDYTSDKTYMTNKIKLNTYQIKNAVNKTFQRYSDKIFLQSVEHNIKTPIEDSNFYQISRFVYDYINWESKIAQNAGQGETCKYTCEDSRFKGSRMQNGNRCDGYVFNCESFSKATIKEEINDRRLYSGYRDNKSGKWYGETDGPGQSVTMSGYTKGFVYCDVCRCTCHNFYGKQVKRWFHNKMIEAPEGYVVTGVRFARKERVFFIQPQISKLTDIGKVDTNSTRWLELPPVKYITNMWTYEDTFTITRPQINDGPRFLLVNNMLKQNQYVTAVGFSSTILGPSQVISVEVIGREVLEGSNGVHLGPDLITGSPDGEQNSYEFKISSRDYDASQHLEPMFDIQDIILESPLPLNGISFYYYKTGGQTQNSFISPRLIAIDVYKRSFD